MGPARAANSSCAFPATATTTGKRMRVLVADDNVDSTQTCSMLLEMWGHEVRVANSGREALDIAGSFQPDVVLLDIGMPDMSGYEVAGAMRSSPWGRKATLIAVTGWGQEDDKQRASAAGFDHHLTKPVEPLHLQPLLESLPLAVAG
jgi:CheY-like chemotaxis protein